MKFAAAFALLAAVAAEELVEFDDSALAGLSQDARDAALAELDQQSGVEEEMADDENVMEQENAPEEEAEELELEPLEAEEAELDDEEEVEVDAEEEVDEEGDPKIAADVQIDEEGDPKIAADVQEGQFDLNTIKKDLEGARKVLGNDLKIEEDEELELEDVEEANEEALDDEEEDEEEFDLPPATEVVKQVRETVKGVNDIANGIKGMVNHTLSGFTQPMN